MDRTRSPAFLEALGENTVSEMIDRSQTYSQDLSALNVLVAEDGLTNRALARGLLTRAGHHVTLANDGRQAVSRLLSDPYDLVLMDVEMPVMDGISATRTLRQQEAELGRHTPVIALTTNTNRDECLAAGMDAFLSKPLDMGAFHLIVAEVLRQGAA